MLPCKDFPARALVRLFRYAMALTKNADEAKDLVQETLYRAWKAKPTGWSSENIFPWLRTIMKNHYVNEWRRFQRWQQWKNQHEMSFWPHAPSLASNETDTKIFFTDYKKVLNMLPRGLRKVVDLYAQGYRYKEIARFLCIPEGTVKSRLFAARKILKPWSAASEVFSAPLQPRPANMRMSLTETDQTQPR
ncbi:MAG: RNA polymerase sigma factor [Chitinophagales bacterium]|nr:RNA polymerase sigma factor [Chitinophagales bacterium]MDW8427653.1 RNA polymerase sigma factor [Chitinophagales bacterium]